MTYRALARLAQVATCLVGRGIAARTSGHGLPSPWQWHATVMSSQLLPALMVMAQQQQQPLLKHA